MTSWCRLCVRTITALLLLAAAMPAVAEPVPFQRIIDLALQRSGTLAIASADQRKARATYSETRAGFLPSVVLGSGLGYSYGIPPTIEGSAPSIFNVNTQQFVLNLPQRDLMRATMRDWFAAGLNLSDQRNSVLQDTAVAYIELDNALSRLKTLAQQQQSASRATFITSERVKEGIDSPLDEKRAQLSAARVQLRMAETQGNIDVLRERISKMTGLQAREIETISDSIPRSPEVSQQQDYSAMAVANSPAVKVLDEKARAAEFRAKAENNQKLPSLDFASQYQLFSKYNNYDEFYRKFSRNNFSVGILVRFPIFNNAQQARVEAAKADAVKAQKEADAIRNQVSEQTLKLQRSLRQLAAANEVARLEYEVAEAGIAGVDVKMQAGQANARDAEQARLDAGDRYLSYLDSQLELARAQVQLLRSSGEIASWALGKQN